MLRNTDSYKRRLTDRLEGGDLVSKLDSFENDYEEIANEKWLISYADMMTLLFGFFVLLYTIAMDTQGRPDKVFSDIVAGKSSLIELQDELKNKEEEMQSLKKGKLEISNQLNEQISQLENKLQKIQKEQVIGLKAEIQNLNSKLSGIYLKIDDFKSQITTLNNQNRAFTADAKKNNFMMIILNWSTPQHDIDLRITDPHGRMFDFQNRFYKESKAKFVVDSRTGPGVEIWQTPQIEAGDYKIEFNFYNAYSNNSPALMIGSIITRKGVFEIPQVKLDFNEDRKKIFKVQVTEFGAITIQSQ